PAGRRLAAPTNPRAAARSTLMRRALLDEAAARAAAYLDGLETRAVAPDEAALAALAALDEPLPQHPLDDGAVLQLLDEIGSPATIAMAGPRFFGFVIGGALPVALAAS